MVHNVTSIKLSGKELNFDVYQGFSELKSLNYLYLEGSFADEILAKQVMSIDVEMDIILSISNLAIVGELIDNIELEVIKRITELIKEKSLDEYVKEIDIGDNEMENILYDYCEDMIQRHHELGLEIEYIFLPHVAPIKIRLNGKYEHFLDLYIALLLYLDGEEQLKKDFELLLNALDSLPLMDEMKEIRKVVG